MNRDPFDHLRKVNPLPEDHPVYPPMATAERITGRTARRAWPAWAVAGGLALAALLVGGGWLLWIRGGTREIAATSAPGTTTAATTTPPGEAPSGDAVVYFFTEDDDTQLAPGPYLIPVARSYLVLSHFVTDPVYETMNFLLLGVYPGEEEAGPALFSAIPAGTQLIGLEVSDGVATVDLSSDLGEAPDFAALRRGLAQIVFTLTRFEGIRAVHFLVEGEPLLSPVRTGIPDPATRADFEDLLPAVLIENPAYWASAGGNPLAVSGSADVFEAVVSLELLDQDGEVLWEGVTNATCGTGCRGEFAAEIPYQVSEGQVGTLLAWETSMEDGRRTNVRRHPVWLNASGEPTTTTPDPISEQLALRYDLDKAIGDTLAQIEAIEAQLTGLAPEEGGDLRTRAAELDQYLFDLREGLSRVYDELQSLGADFAVPCSGEIMSSELEGQPGLPEAVAGLRTRLYEAARACNWEALQGLLADPAGFSYSFGERGDPVAYWQRLEFLHYRPTYYLAEVLRRPFGTVEDGGSTVYVWPSAQAYGSWAQVPTAEREALRPLYDDLDFASFEEFGGYLGFRVGIVFANGSAHWIYAIEGD
jgi:hypothetical protein